MQQLLHFELTDRVFLSKFIIHVGCVVLLLCCIYLSIYTVTMDTYFDQFFLLIVFLMGSTTLNVLLSNINTHLDDNTSEQTRKYKFRPYEYEGVFDCQTSDDNELCRVCLVNQKCVRVLPCLHIGTCIGCTRKLRSFNCMVCNVPGQKFEHYNDSILFH